MSWRSIPLPNPFKSLQSDDEESHTSSPEPSSLSPEQQNPSHGGGGGVQEDFSVLGQTIGRQFRGVAAILAPLPASTTAAEDNSADDAFAGIRNDLVEIGGAFKSGLSLFSSNKAVTEISKFASNFLQFQNDDEEKEEDNKSEDCYGGDVAAITEEVMEFVNEISSRPECWIEFPLSLHNDFNMSDAQRKHASTIEHLAPSIAALRLDLRNHMSDEHFWMIYFILLLPRLDENGLKLLASPEVAEAREILLQKLQDKRNSQISFKNSGTLILSQEGNTRTSERQRENRPARELLAEAVTATEGEEPCDKENIEEQIEKKDDDVAQKKLENDEDVSFSDLDDDDHDLSKIRQKDRGNSPPDVSSEWVQLSHGSISGRQKVGQSTFRGQDSEGEESNDWLTVDDFDLDS